MVLKLGMLLLSVKEVYCVIRVLFVCVHYQIFCLIFRLDCSSLSVCAIHQQVRQSVYYTRKHCVHYTADDRNSVQDTPKELCALHNR